MTSRETELTSDLQLAKIEYDKLKEAVETLLKVPEVRKAAANWATDELLEVRNAMEGWPKFNR